MLIFKNQKIIQVPGDVSQKQTKNSDKDSPEKRTNEIIIISVKFKMKIEKLIFFFKKLFCLAF